MQVPFSGLNTSVDGHDRQLFGDTPLQVRQDISHPLKVKIFGFWLFCFEQIWFSGNWMEQEKVKCYFGKLHL